MTEGTPTEGIARREGQSSAGSTLRAAGKTTSLTVSLVSRRYMRGVAEMKFSGSCSIRREKCKNYQYFCQI